VQVASLLPDPFHVLCPSRPDIIPEFVPITHRIWIYRLRMAARTGSSDRTARVMLEKRFGHLRASAVSRAEEEHAWAPASSATIQGPRSDHVEPQAGLQSRS